MIATSLLGRSRSRLSGLSTRIGRLSPIAQACLCIWLLAGLYGAYHTLAGLPGYLRWIRPGGGYTERTWVWGALEGFAEACGPRLASRASVLLVDPTGQITGAAQYLQAPDVDLDDTRVLAYALYPHLITSLGHVPNEWAPASASTDYIALWEKSSAQPSTVSTARARASSRTAESTLRAALPRGLVCTYTDQQGNRGVVYAVSPLATHALAANVGRSAPGGVSSSTRTGTSWTAYLLAAFAVLSVWAIGALWLSFVPRRRLVAGLRAAAALPLGCLAITLELLLYSALGVPWAPLWLLLPWLALAGIVLWRNRAALGDGISWQAARTALVSGWQGLALDERIVLGALGALVAGLAVATPLGLPFGDGLNFAFFRARAFFLDGSITPYYAHAAALAFTVPAHPPLIPLSVVWLYTLIGGLNEQAALVLWPALFACLVGAFYAFARTVAPRRAALWSTLAFALIAYDALQAALWASYSDMPLAVYLLLGGGLLWWWAASDRRSPVALALAGLLLGAAAITKEEALFAAVFAFAASPLLSLERRRAGRLPLRAGWWLPLAWGAPLCALVLLPWLLFQHQFHVPEVTVQLAGRSAIVLLQRLAAIVIALTWHVATHWLAMLTLMVAWGVLCWRLGRSVVASLASISGRAWFLASLIVLQLAADCLGMTSIPVDVHNVIAWDTDRLLLQLAPLVFLGGVALWPTILRGGQGGVGQRELQADADVGENSEERVLTASGAG